MYPSLKEFLKLSKQGNVIPVYKEINADLDTPVSSFLKLSHGDYAFLLESVEGQEKLARYSFLGSKPCLVFISKGRQIEISDLRNKSTRKFITATSALDEIKKLMQDFRFVPVAGLPRFCGGLVGYMGYDSVRSFERIPDKNPDDLKLPDSIFMLTDNLLVFDHVNHTIKIVHNVMLAKNSSNGLKKKKALYARAINKIEALHKELNLTVRETAKTLNPKTRCNKVSSNFTKSGFENIVKQALAYIRNGDVIQVVLSQRFKIKINQQPFEIYRKLRRLNPSPYMYYLKLKGFFIIGASPEMLVRCEDGLVQARPIAGTRARGKNSREDALLSAELLHDKKEKAEHLMLVDLSRNDLGKVCLNNSIEVKDFMSIEKYSHVMHLVSEVKGTLDKKSYSIYDVLPAAFPAGTVSGSPKIRAMEIIDELETLKRGPYAGCVGYFSFSHNLDTCITIRTIIVKDGFAYIQAGAGIVADSQPEKEYFESVNKAKALVEAIKQ